MVGGLSWIIPCNELVLGGLSSIIPCNELVIGGLSSIIPLKKFELFFQPIDTFPGILQWIPCHTHINQFKHFLGILQLVALRIKISCSAWIETSGYAFEKQPIPEFPKNSWIDRCVSDIWTIAAEPDSSETGWKKVLNFFSGSGRYWAWVLGSGY